MVQSWEALRKEARRLETEIDTKLVDYSKVAATLQTSSSATRAPYESAHSATEDEAIQRRPLHDRRDAANTAEIMTNDMEILLSKLQTIIEAMQSTSQTNQSSTGSHTLQRHSEILYDYQQEFRKTRNSITILNEHSELLSGAQSNNLENSSNNNENDNANGLESLYKERESISNSNMAADNAINTGLNLKEDLDRQRAMFASMVERMETMSEGLPAVNRLIGQIRRKKKRDVLILGIVISTLLFITFSWKVLG